MSNALYIQAKPEIDRLIDHYEAELTTRVRGVFGPQQMAAQGLGGGILINVLTRFVASVLKTLQGGTAPAPGTPGTPPAAPNPNDLITAVLAAVNGFVNRLLGGALGGGNQGTGGLLGGLLTSLVQSVLPGLVGGLVSALDGILKGGAQPTTPGATTGFVPY